LSDSYSPTAITTQIHNGLVALGFSPDEHPIDTYRAYIELLVKWNRAYNLTGIDQAEKMVAYHILDSLAVLPYVKGGQCLDIGSGAGLPGLILALAKPEQHWSLLDSSGKKIRFINQAVIELGLSNVEAVNCRIENFSPEPRFSTVTVRAWGKLVDLYKVAAHLLQAKGRILAMKGPDVMAELAALEKKEVNVYKHKLDVPGVEGERMLIEITALPSGK